MGYYVPGAGPPPRRRWWQRCGRYVPQRIKDCWADVQEITAMTRLVFSIVLPVIAVLIAFVLICAGALFLFTAVTGGR